MTRLEKFWRIFQAENLHNAPPTPKWAMTQAYARGAMDTLTAVHAMHARTPAEAEAYLHGLELFIRKLLDEPRPKETMQ